MTFKTEVTEYTDAQAEAAKLDSVYRWFDVSVTTGEGAGKFAADYVVGVDAGRIFRVDWEGGDYLGVDGENAVICAVDDFWNKGA